MILHFLLRCHSVQTWVLLLLDVNKLTLQTRHHEANSLPKALAPLLFLWPPTSLPLFLTLYSLLDSSLLPEHRSQLTVFLPVSPSGNISDAGDDTSVTQPALMEWTK